jgi:hypothetical protein
VNHESLRAATERAQRLLRGEPVLPEAVEVERVFLVDPHDHIICSFCGSAELNIRAVAPNRELAPDEATLLLGCRSCGTTFFVQFSERPDGIVVWVGEA